MAVEVTISLLKMKLENLLGDKDVEYPRFRRRVNRTIEELQELQACLGKGESIKGNNRPNLPPELLRDLYSVCDIVDSFRLTSSLRRQQPLLKKMRPFVLLMSGWSQFYLSRKLKIAMRSQFLSSRAMEKLVIKVDKLEDNLEGVPDQPPAPGDAGARGDRHGPSVAGSQDQGRSQSNWDQFAHSTEESGIVGMDDQAEELADTVLASRSLLFLVWVVGPPGCGKTTLVRKVYTRVDVKQHFQCCAWVSVPGEFNEQELLIEVLRQVTAVGAEETLPPGALREKVRDSLSRKRYLIVLDDIQSTEVWENLKFAFPNPLNGSKVVLTMREAKDAPPVERRPEQWIKILKVRRLNVEESWALFLNKVRKADDKSIELIKLKEKIWIKSNGLPLPIVLLGGLLSTKKFDPGEWLKVIDSATLNIEQFDSRDILAVGYHDLPSPLKACLLYMGLFPRSYEVQIRRLLQLWIAEGLAMTSDGETGAPEDWVEGYLKELVERNMVEVARWRLDGSPRTCRMPGILYDTLFPRAAELGFFHVHSNSNYSDKHVWRLAEYSDIGGYPDSDPYNIKHLRSFISFNIRKGDSPTDGFDKLLKMIVARRGFGLLTVLDLEHVYKPVLSETLGKLLYLKYLGLRWTFLDSVPASIAKLSCLETLDVKHTNITTLPISIWKATNLRHLYMNDIHFDVSTQLQNSSSIGESLSKLRTLWGLLIGNNSSVVKWLQRLASLRKLGLTCHESSMQEIVDWVCGLTNLQSLRLRSIDKFNQPSELNLKSLRLHNDLKELYLLGKLSRGINISEIPQNLKILTLSVSHLKEDPMPTLGKLPHLNILRLFARSFSGEEMKCLSDEFPELRVLKLWLLEELERWTVEQGSLRRLKELEIRCCTKLELPGGLKHVTSLKEMTLTNMPKNFSKKMKAEMSSNNVYIKINNWDLPNSRKDSQPEKKKAVPILCHQCRKNIQMDAQESLYSHKPQ